MTYRQAGVIEYDYATLNSLGVQGSGRGGGGFSHLMLTGLFRHDTTNITNSFIMSSAKFLPVFCLFAILANFRTQRECLRDLYSDKQ